MVFTDRYDGRISANDLNEEEENEKKKVVSKMTICTNSTRNISTKRKMHENTVSMKQRIRRLNWVKSMRAIIDLSGFSPSLALCMWRPT